MAFIINSAVKDKRRCWKTWKKVGSRDEYQMAKRLVKHTVYMANSQAEQKVLKEPSPSSSEPGQSNAMQTPGPWFNIKMTSYQDRKSYCGENTVVRSSYLHNGISYTGKMSSLYWIRVSGGRLNKKDGLTRYGDSHVKDKTSWRPSYL